MTNSASRLSSSVRFLDDGAMQDWSRLGKLVIARRVNLGFNTRGEFAELLGLTTRVLGDIETGRRDNYDRATIAKLERALSWETGSVDRILDGGDAELIRGPIPSTGSEIPGDEIDLIYASATMTAEEKLLRIRQVLQLRAQAEAHERDRQKAKDNA